MLTLLVLQGPDKGRRFELPDSPALLGRGSRQIPVSDLTVSRKHAELLPQNGEWVLKDLGSINGSYVNGVRVETLRPLKLGDQIRIGRTLMVFGAQPGVSRASGGAVTLAGEEAGMDAAIVQTVPSNEDSMVLAVPEPAVAAMANLKILYQLGAALGSSFGLNQILELVMDLVFEHISADRGIILLVDERTGDVTPQVVRIRDEDHDAKGEMKPDARPDPDAAKIHASRTIINYVITKGEGVLSSNAMADQRFSKGKSVHNLGIRSALAVPIKARRLTQNAAEEIIGVIYIDSSVKNYTYSADQLRLLTAIGVQAGLAVQNAKLNQQTVQAERLAAVGETTAALSHSIKNILQALHGGSDVVEMGLRSSNLGQATKGWRIVERNLQKIYGLTTNLLAYSRPREPRLENVVPKTLVDDCLELIAATARERGTMAIADVDRDVPPVPMDPDGMHQVLLNLLSNALDAVEPGSGVIRVSCRFDAPARELIFEVVDNGAGIPTTMMSHMFELFHSTKGNRGTGLGLAVAKKIVDEHDGEITVTSKPGEGSSFVVRLPVVGIATDPSQTHGPTR